MEEIQVEEKKWGRALRISSFSPSPLSRIFPADGGYVFTHPPPLSFGPSDTQYYEGATYRGLFLAPNFLDHGGRRAGSQKNTPLWLCHSQTWPLDNKFPKFRFFESLTKSTFADTG